MSTSQETPQPPHVSPKGSATPLISSDQRQEAQQKESDAAVDGVGEDRDPKTGKRRFFGFGKKKEEKEQMPPPSQPAVRSASPGKAPTNLNPTHPQPIPISPSRNVYQSAVAASPSRLRSSSPRLHSPASSEIFERSVQEPVQISTLQGELSPAHIPTHVITEDHIPPALEASAQAITSEELNPDDVEIVMSASHQPAASVLEGSTSHADLTQLNSPMPPLHHVRSEESETSIQPPGVTSLAAEEDGASNYGQLDPTDPRRLSFISFADVVQSEHHQAPTSAVSEPGNRDSLYNTGLASSLHLKQERAASPLRTPLSPASTHSHSLSGGVATPPPSTTVNPLNPEQSPGRSIGGLGSPVSQHGDLQVETMRQAVRHSASGDLTGARSAGMSPVSDDNLASAPRSRTNS